MRVSFLKGKKIIIFSRVFFNSRLFYSNKTDRIILTKKKQLDYLFQKIDYKNKIIKAFESSGEFNINEIKIFSKKIKYNIECETYKHYSKKMSITKQFDFLKNKKESLINLVFLLEKKSSVNSSILDYNKSCMDHYIILQLYLSLYHTASKQGKIGNLLNPATSIKPHHIKHALSSDYKKFHHLSELQKSHNYDSLIQKLKKHDLFNNSSGNKFSTLYDRSVFISNEELSSLELGYNKYKVKQLLLNKDCYKNIIPIYTSLNSFSVLNSKGECFYSREMLDSYSYLKLHDTDINHLPNHVPSSIKDTISSFSLKDVIIISKVGDVKKVLDYVYHDASIDILNNKKKEFQSFEKYITQADKYIFKSLEKNIHDVYEIKINNAILFKPTKEEIIPYFIKHFEYQKPISIDVHYSTGLTSKLYFDLHTNKFIFTQAGILEADQLGGESPSPDGDEDNSI